MLFHDRSQKRLGKENAITPLKGFSYVPVRISSQYERCIVGRARKPVTQSFHRFRISGIGYPDKVVPAGSIHIIQREELQYSLTLYIVGEAVKGDQCRIAPHIIAPGSGSSQIRCQSGLALSCRTQSDFQSDCLALLQQYRAVIVQRLPQAILGKGRGGGHNEPENDTVQPVLDT
jgi:hypothetical protein